MDTLANQLARLPVVGRPVVNDTSVAGSFDYEVTYAPPPNAAADTAVVDDRPAIFTALQEQLGVMLRPSRGPVEVMVVDRVARPTPD